MLLLKKKKSMPLLIYFSVAACAVLCWNWNILWKWELYLY